MGAVDFPQDQLPARLNGTRFIHVRQNRPGVLIQLIEIFASRGLNIVAEFPQTNGDTGDVVIEAEDVRDNRRHPLDAARVTRDDRYRGMPQV